MRRRHSGSMLLLVMLCCLCLAASDAVAQTVKLKGSGASFPFPLYGRWFKDYGKVNKQVQVDYQAKGSGAGIKDFVNKTVDFAASDAAMTDEEIASVDVGVQLLPMTAGKIVLAYNLPNGPKDLKLSREAYTKIFNKQVQVDYQAKGSGAGIKDFVNKTVDFAASDAAMTDEEIASVDVGVQLLPMTAGKIVLAYNLPNGPKDLKLSREAYTKIFLGQITKWNDPVIAKANPGVTLPDTAITVVRRADSSGTTFVFTQHLSAVSEAWKNGPGSGTTVNWPSSDKFVASPKNDGVAATIKQTPGAIGYIEYGFAKITKLPMAWLENKAGKFVEPSLEAGKPPWQRDAPSRFSRLAA